MEPIKKYAGFEQKQLKNDFERHRENLELLGYSIAENVLSPDHCDQMVTILKGLWKKQEAEFGKERLIQLGEYDTHRGLLKEDKVFADLLMHPKALEMVYPLIGESAIAHLQNATVAWPSRKHMNGVFHRDFAKDFVSSRLLALNVMWCLTDFTEDNGATWLVPCTHKTPEVPSNDFLEKNAIQACAPKGSLILWDSLLIHRAGINRTDAPRYGINHMYTRACIKQQIDFPVFLKGLYDEESRLGQMLGFWAISPKSVAEFRVDPDKRTYRRGQG